MNWFRILCVLLISTLSIKADPNDVISKGLSLPTSQKAIDLIIYYEVGSKSDFEKYYAKPEVPAWQSTSSGVTVGIGFDCGMSSKEQVYKAFNGILSDRDIKLLQSVTGMTGKNAYYNALPKVRNNIRLTWDEAQRSFKSYTLPTFSQQTSKAFNLTPDRLHPHSNGALISLVYNRGPSLSSSDSRKEMRWIKYNISIGNEDDVPSDIKSMKRLWGPSLKGLWLRRDAEAELFKLGVQLK